ncbi:MULTISPECIES: hypothetical protein [unclassified Paenibacillus]|uniref:hypothetical protein n=1 Tax=unclassified Paenibacillus TaxID=185978 RepID=UPI00083829EE|nr:MULTISPECIES: hypothetical protein [unclassified Paenibacillus]NWL89118.1 hypothetical protein [Paenibacillus sp. 79R4]
MKWHFFLMILIMTLLVILLEWKGLKTRPIRDKVVFISLLLLVLGLSMLDLPNTPGPTTLILLIYKPLERLLEL